MRKFIFLSAAAALTATSLAAIPTPADARQQARQQREWRGSDGRMHCRRSNGTVGLVVGGVAGALVGREIARKRTCR